jgi:hypothetical protein
MYMYSYIEELAACVRVLLSAFFRLKSATAALIASSASTVPIRYTVSQYEQDDGHEIQAVDYCCSAT